MPNQYPIYTYDEDNETLAGFLYRVVRDVYTSGTVSQDFASPTRVTLRRTTDEDFSASVHFAVVSGEIVTWSKRYIDTIKDWQLVLDGVMEYYRY